MTLDYTMLMASIAATVSVFNLLSIVVALKNLKIMSGKVDSIRLTSAKLLFNKPEKCEKCGKEIESHTIKEAKECEIKLS
jgi:predicted Zn-ribbon and HTH transcriptional regulator